jgi:protein-tyrosine phosphatase
MDDGAADWGEAVEMCRQAAGDGTTLLAATPHWYPNRNPPSLAEIQAALDRLREELAGFNLGLELVAGAEVALDPELPRLAREGLVPTLGESSCFLLECPPQTSPRLLPGLIYELRLAGLRPILSHPERTWSGARGWDWLARLVEQGCLVQLTAMSLTGALGQGARAASQELLERGLVHLVASDAHSAGWRTPRLSEAAAHLERLAGAEAAELLTRGAPAAILAGREPPATPIPQPRRGLFFWRR